MTNADWWAKQLGTNTQPTPVARPTSIPMPPSQQPMTPYMPPQPQVQQTSAKSAQQTATCPECNGSNYLAVQNATPRCYDCGYPIGQSGSRYGALTGARVEGSAKGALGNSPSTGFSMMPEGYNPDGSKQ